jgi:DNA replication protein DnaC
MNEETITKMKAMKLSGMVRAFTTSLENEQQNKYTPDEMVDFLIQSEWDDRQNRTILRLITSARFRYNANVESLHYDNNRNLDKNQILRYADCSYIKENENILITGSTGIGKSYIATALGYQACMLGYKVMYANTSKLFSRLKMAKANGIYVSEMAKIERQHLLILDDFGLQPLDTINRNILMEIIEDRHGKGASIITSQLPVNKWYEVIGEKTIADAILDRIVHSAHRIEIKGESLRKKLTDQTISKEIINN